MKTQQPDDGRQLIASAVDSTMVDDDLPLLYQRLADDEEARNEFVQQILIDAELKELFSSDNVVAALDAGVMAFTEPMASRQTPRSRWFAVMLSVAALALTTIFITTDRQPDTGMVASDAKTPRFPLADAEGVVVTPDKGPSTRIPRELSEQERNALNLLTVVADISASPSGGSAAAKVLYQLFRPAVQAAREAARRNRSGNNLKQIVLAIQSFSAIHGRLPALYSTDTAGKPLLSWRVHLLPYLENEELYRRFRLNEPWDSEHNRALLSEMPTTYRCPETADDSFVTNYLAISSESSFLTPPAKGMFGATTPLGISMKQVTDGTSNTIAIVEVSDDRACEWTRPQDFPVVVDNPLGGLGHARDPQIVLTAFADGAVKAINRNLDTNLFLGLATRNGGEPVDSP